MPLDRWLRSRLAIVAVLALYRAGSFIHELTHIKPNAVPGFRLVWNLLVGIPLLVPSFMYEGVHNLHHAKRYYGTVDDPEYLPLALMKPWTLPVFMLVAALAPVGLLIRFGVLAPLSLLSRSCARPSSRKYSGLQINPRFRRPQPEGEFRRQWLWHGSGCSVWAIALLAMVATGVIPLRAFLIFLGVAAGVMVLNQVRTLVAHLWENDGEPMTVTAQYPRQRQRAAAGDAPGLWAPVGLRYHALHHLLPGCPTMRSARRIAGCARRSKAAPSITIRAIAICTSWSGGWRRAAGAPARPTNLFEFDEAYDQVAAVLLHDNLALALGPFPFFSIDALSLHDPHARSRLRRRCGGGDGGEDKHLPIIRRRSLNRTLRFPPKRTYSSERIRTVSPISRNSTNGAQAARIGG